MDNNYFDKGSWIVITDDVIRHNNEGHNIMILVSGNFKNQEERRLVIEILCKKLNGG